MPVSIRGTAGGSVTLSSGAAAADTTLTLPNTTGTVALTASPTFSGTLTATTITSPSATALTFQYGGTTGATLDSSGNLLLNTTTSPTYAIQTGTTKNGSPNVRWEWGPSIVNASYYVVPAGAASGVYINSGNTSWSSNSDERLKNITANIENAAQSVNSLRAVRFTWKSDEENKPNVGLIAQDVLAVLPEAVTKDRGYYGVKYTEVIPLLTAAIQELSAKNDALEARLAALEAK
jgi:hypothetical protein